MQSGEGLGREPLVLLPGMMCDARVYAPQIRALSGQVAVMVAPLRGGSTIEEIAAHILAQLPEQFALAGHSMGAIVAMEILRRAPGRVSRLCLMSSTALAETPAQASEREPMIIGAQTGRLEEVLRQSMHPDFLAPGMQRIGIINDFCEMGLELGPELFVAQSRALQRRQDQQAALARCRVPALVMCGEHDRLTPVKRHEAMAAVIPGARLKVLSGAGHMPMLERPGAVSRALADWLAEPLQE